jgi:hypothetical protein
MLSITVIIIMINIFIVVGYHNHIAAFSSPAFANAFNLTLADSVALEPMRGIWRDHHEYE